MTRSILLLLLLPLMTALAVRAAAGAELRADRIGPARSVLPLEHLAAEAYRYDVSFLWFDDLARGRLCLSPGDRPGIWRATLEAETRGMIGWLTAHRVQRYVSEMEAGPDGRLRSLVHEAHIIRGRGSGRTDIGDRYLFDHRGRTIRHQELRGGEVVRELLVPMEGGRLPDDFLTAFYNLRLGAFGPLEPGARFDIPILGRKGISPLVVEILSPGTGWRKDFFPESGTLGRVRLDPAVFKTGGGWIYVWFDPSGRPAKGLIEDVIGLGDVRGRMRD